MQDEKLAEREREQEGKDTGYKLRNSYESRTKRYTNKTNRTRNHKDPGTFEKSLYPRPCLEIGNLLLGSRVHTKDMAINPCIPCAGENRKKDENQIVRLGQRERRAGSGGLALRWRPTQKRNEILCERVRFVCQLCEAGYKNANTKHYSKLWRNKL